MCQCFNEAESDFFVIGASCPKGVPGSDWMSLEVRPS